MKKKRQLAPEKNKDEKETSDNMENTLSPRETEILTRLKEGNRYEDVAAVLYISTETVRTHAHKIYKKLKVRNKIQAINKFFENK